MVQVALYKGRSRLFDRVVQWWTRGPYSHVEIVTHRSYSGAAACISSSWLDGGVRGKWIHLRPDRWDVFEVEGDSQAAIAWLERHQGKPYDTLGLLGFVFRPMKDNRRRWFCSEAVAAILGYPEPWRFSPNDLANVLTKRKG